MISFSLVHHCFHFILMDYIEGIKFIALLCMKWNAMILGNMFIFFFCSSLSWKRVTLCKFFAMHLLYHITNIFLQFKSLLILHW